MNTIWASGPECQFNLHFGIDSYLPISQQALATEWELWLNKWNQWFCPAQLHNLAGMRSEWDWEREWEPVYFCICIFLQMCFFVFVYSCICFQFAKCGQKGEQLSWVRASAGEFARSADTERPAVALRLSRRTHLLTMYIAPNLWEHISGTNLWEKHLCAVKWHSLRHIFSMKEGFSQCDSNLCLSTNALWAQLTSSSRHWKRWVFTEFCLGQNKLSASICKSDNVVSFHGGCCFKHQLSLFTSTWLILHWLVELQ